MFAAPSRNSYLYDAEQGKRVFEKAGCFVCHGNEGSGGVRNKNSLTAERVPPLTYVSRGYTDQALKEKILRGSTLVRKLDPSGFTPPLSMPSFRGRLADPDIDLLIEYLHSLTPEEGEEL
jgi:cytochrome c